MASDNEKEIHHMLGSIQSDVKHVLTTVTLLTGRIDGLEKRITAVEKFNVRVLTITTFIGVGIAAFLSGIVKKFLG